MRFISGKTLTAIGLSLGLLTGTAKVLMAQTVPLSVVQEYSDERLGWDEQLWGDSGHRGDRQALLSAIDRSLKYLRTGSAAKAYRNYPVPGITRERVIRSLVRFRQLLASAGSAGELQAAVKREFGLYRATGHDKQGNVHFTGYFEPVYPASRQPSAEYPYPLYRKPANFNSWSKPHPTRAALEGEDGLLGKKSPLSGLELVWLKDRLAAYLVHVQGSAKLRLPDGKMMGVGYDGSTDYHYTSIGRELIDDGIFTPEELSLPVLIDYLKRYPEKLKDYLPRNNRFIFFRETHGAPAQGSLGVPVTAERSIATDKSLMPPGALALIHTPIPLLTPNGIEKRLVSRYVLDQDTGSAIKGPGRVDIFMGTGQTAGDRAGLINNTGELYYLLLK
jgi:membrane-bound lytic murein transglycosylase A